MREFTFLCELSL